MIRSSRTPPSGAQIIEYWARPVVKASGFETTAPASASPAVAPSTMSSPMCERSNRPTRSRTARCSSRIEVYCTGIRQPAKSIMRAPRASWRLASGVSWMTDSVVPGSVTNPAPDRSRDSLRRRWRRQDAGRVGHECALGLEGQQGGRLREIDPADLIELMIMSFQRPTDRLHQEIVDGLVDPRPRLHERVVDPIERSGDPHLEPGLLADLTQRRLFGRLVTLRGAFGERPGPAVALTPAAADDELGSPGLVPNDDAARGGGGRSPQACHGAGAALGRRADPERPERAQCIVTAGRARCARTMGCAGRGPRLVARRRS